MEFHISCHHTPNNCGVHRRAPGEGNAVPNWSEHCKKTELHISREELTHLSITILCSLKLMTWPNYGI